ncbi:MAG: hypothetical protein A2X28_02700 [Elusimicrobia bacterium GWA2_56_46]|nr:MAG: hypothetical protein A2X28_02700 [Elusimicrobia bacterium GWA2_56_46]OGR55331.1 MAG: hypothetical protein A2X39_00265 [Elusimicrobia bacterium GWC2_56_31]HBB67587.1 hypothetical protein [Elusimicrobiota bacterium]HBW23135.1 hypothetical protein [Elusimicrobiota bacterium]
MPAFFLLGLFSLITQVFTLKELSGLLLAHETALGLGLSAWLLWTAAGMALVLKGRLAKRLESPRGFLAACAVFTAAAGLNLLLFRKAELLLSPGLIPGLLELTAFSLFLTLPAALANGVCLARGLAEKRLAFYRAETYGAAAGGLLTLLHSVFFPGADPLLICGLAALALIFSAPGTPLLNIRKLVPAALAGALFFGGAHLVPPFALPTLFKTARAYARTTGSRLAILDSPGQRLFIEDGTILAQLPPAEQTEISVQLPLLAHKKPQEILFAGPAGLLLAAEAGKHGAKNITVSDPDRFRTAFIIKYAGPGLEPARIERTDPRLLLKKRPGAYDLIFQTAPEPLNAAANRFFTVEFFREAAAALRSGGILVFTLPFSENYLPPERAYFAASILASVSAAFKRVELVPGGILTVLASDSAIDLSPETLARRYRQRKIHNLYAVPENFPFLLDPYRGQWARAAAAKVKAPRLNTDLDPAAYFYLWKMWLAMFVSPGALTGLALLAVIFVLLLSRFLRPAELLNDRKAAAVFLAGFWAMGFEVDCLLMFQTYSGQLNWKLGILFAGFMAGAAAGTSVFKNLPRLTARAAALLLALALTAGLYLRAPGLAAMPPAGLFFLFMGLIFGGGLALGGYFVAVAGAQDGEAGRLYYSDLLGAALGGFVFSAALIPLAGLRTSLLWAAAALTPGLLPCLFASAPYSENESTVKT